MDLKYITTPVADELERFNALYNKTLQTNKQDFQFMLDFISAKKGKQIRPLILLLSAKLCGRPTQKTLEYAVILELLHTATLIHDDVVDNTRERRGQRSAMAEFDNRPAVLLGDYILAQAITCGVATNDMPVLQIMAKLAQNLAEGELTQLIAAADTQIDEQRYFEIIRKKTAVLLASCTEMGALSVAANAEQVDLLRTIGENLGLCFQLRDDIFDYFDSGELGKPTGNDLREGKITLPLIYALQTAADEQSAPIFNLLKQREFSAENINTLLCFAKEHGGIDYACRKMQEIKAQTVALLAKFPDSEAKTAFAALIDYIIERKK